jgi:hypothetical protein
MRLLRFPSSPTSRNAELDEEITDLDRANALRRLADRALAEIEIERIQAGLITPEWEREYEE